ncbi:MAG: 5-formyltetrahydrofolate cyclo-ligase [Acidiferrobacterales bacterium]
MKTWDEVKTWRAMMRKKLLERRAPISAEQRRRDSRRIEATLTTILGKFQAKTIGFYWPALEGEFDPLPLVRPFLESGGTVALPVFENAGAPMRFCRWAPGRPLVPGAFKIPMPKEREIVTPDVVLVPVLGIDRHGFRLGLGAGLYDRTLAVLDPRPYAIGIGFEFQRLETIYPQPFDMPMDLVVTETGQHLPEH